MKIIILAINLFLLSLPSFSQQEKNDVMKATAVKLLKYLSTSDTASIIKLHARYNDAVMNDPSYNGSRIKVWNDCKTYQNISKIYGTPKAANFIITDGFNGIHELAINLFTNKDTVLKMNYSKIVIRFYPFSFYNPDKVMNYYIEIGKDKSDIIKPLRIGN